MEKNEIINNKNIDKDTQINNNNNKKINNNSRRGKRQREKRKLLKEKLKNKEITQE